MGAGYGADAGAFLIQTLFGLVLLLLLLRIVLQAMRANLDNPLSQFVYRASQPVVQPLSRVVPNLGRLSGAALLLLVVVQFVEILALALVGGFRPHLAGVAILTVAELLDLLILFYTVLIIVNALSSWFTQSYNPMLALIYRLCEPLLAPARRLGLVIGGIDLSPLAVLIGLQLARIVIVQPLFDFGRLTLIQGL